MWHLILHNDEIVKNPGVPGPHRERLLQGKQLGPRAAPAHRSSRTMAMPAQEQGWDGDSDLRQWQWQLRNLQSLGETSADVWTEVCPGSSPQARVRMRTGEMSGQGQRQLQHPRWSHGQVTSQCEAVPKTLELSYYKIFYHHTTWSPDCSTDNWTSWPQVSYGLKKPSEQND